MLKNNTLFYISQNHSSVTVLKHGQTDGHEYSIVAVDKPQLLLVHTNLIGFIYNKTNKIIPCSLVMQDSNG